MTEIERERERERENVVRSFDIPDNEKTYVRSCTTSRASLGGYSSENISAIIARKHVDHLDVAVMLVLIAIFNS